MINLRLFLRIIVPKKIRRYVKDTMEYLYRQFPGEIKVNDRHGLEVTQIYPKGKNLISILELATKEKLSAIELNKKTPIASIGTCFAEEFAFHMQSIGYNYIKEEKDKFAASANWGRVYTVPNLLQIVRYSTEDDFPVVVEESEKGWFDPLRETMGTPFFLNKKIAEEAIIKHRQASCRAFKKCSILIITVGQNEAWCDSSTNMIWARNPPENILETRRGEFSVKEFNFNENLMELRKVVNILKDINSEIKIIFTVSPVASYATFSDKDVISNSLVNKCILRAVVNELIASELSNLFYFPSFEIVLCDNPKNFRADNRHVKYSTVDRIFSLLENSTINN